MAGTIGSERSEPEKRDEPPGADEPGAVTPAGDPLPAADANDTADTASPPSEEDGNVDPGGPVADTGSAAADTEPAPTIDASTADTEVADTSAPDTKITDTSVADTSVADTGVADTGVIDTGVTDTAPKDSGIVTTAWRKANLTYYTSYPDPGSEECIKYNGCTWAGQFAALDGKQPESWVKANNIAAVHGKDFETYKLKTLRLRQGTRQIDVKVYDMCADSDCSGCCTANSKTTGFLIDIESYTAERFGTNSGIVEWVCLDC